MKTNDVVSERDVNFSNVLYIKAQPFLPENMRSFCSAKSSCDLSTRILLQKVAGLNPALLATEKTLCQPSSKWVPFSNQERRS